MLRDGLMVSLAQRKRKNGKTKTLWGILVCHRFKFVGDVSMEFSYNIIVKNASEEKFIIAGCYKLIKLFS